MFVSVLLFFSNAFGLEALLIITANADEGCLLFFGI